MKLSYLLNPHPKTLTAPKIREWKRALKSIKDDLLLASAKDSGRLEDENFLLEWGSVESALDFLEDNVDEVFRVQQIPSSLKKMLGQRKLFLRRIPLGKVLVVGTWNYPLSLHLVQILFALAGGNQVTFKSSPLTPHINQAFKKHLSKIFKEENFSVWEPVKPEEVITAISKREFQLVIFTGGTSAAKIFSKACGEAMIPFVSEASGSEAAIILDQDGSPKDLQQTLDHLLWGSLHFSGQTCVAPRFYFVPKKKLEVYFEAACRTLDESEESLSTRAVLKSDNVRNEDIQWGAWIESQKSHKKFVSKHRAEFKVYQLPSARDLPAESPPTFGPSIAIVGYENLAEVVKWVQQSPWSLLTSVFGQPNSADLALLDDLDATIISWNESVVSVGDAAIPFGGRGESGFGVCHGVEGLMHMTRSQTWVETKPWPGLSSLRPTWKGLRRLGRAAQWMKGFEEKPLATAKAWVGENIFKSRRELVK